MTDFKRFFDTGRELVGKDEASDEMKFEAYIRTNGEACAKGYLNALAEITDELDKILNPEDKATPETPEIVRKNLKNYVAHNQIVLKKYAQALGLYDRDEPTPAL